MDGVDWKQKYFQLEAKMLHFHSQASDIRQKLAVKIADLTVECENATKRAVRAEDEVNLLQKKMLKNAQVERIKELEECLQEQRDLLAESEARLQNELQRREDERESVHNKTIRLKQWIAEKMQEVENQKKELFEANKRATTSLYEMKMKVQELSMELVVYKQSENTTSVGEITDATALSRTSSPNTMDISNYPQVPEHATIWSSRTPVAISNKQNVESRRLWSPLSKNRHQSSHSDQENFSVIHDSSSVSTMETITPLSSMDFELNKKDKSPTPGSPARELVSKVWSSEGYRIETSSSLKNDNNILKNFDENKKKKKSATLPMTRSAAKKGPSTQHHSSLIETFGSITRKFRGFTDHHHQQSPSARRVRRTQSAGKKEDKARQNQESNSSKNKSKHVSSPVSANGRDLPKSRQSSSSKHGLCITGGPTTSLISESLEEEEEKSPGFDSMETSPSYFSSSMPSTILSSVLPRTKPVNLSISRSRSLKSSSSVKPPTPPLHRVPLWETRIYNLTKCGFHVRDINWSRIAPESSASVQYHCLGEKTSNIYKKSTFHIPVYTKISEKISQISRTPFTSLSDSPDDEMSTISLESSLHSLNNFLSPSTTEFQPHSPALQQSRNASPGSARAIKRANSTQSFTSSEGDYSIPPDALSLCSDSSEPEHKLFKTGKTGVAAARSNKINSSSSNTSPENGSSPGILPTSLIVEKCGYLALLDGRSCTWTKHWFVLKPGKLQYFNSPNDMSRKHIGKIQLNPGACVLHLSTSASQTMFRITLERRNIYLNADSLHIANDWIRALNIAMNKPPTLGLQKYGRRHSMAKEKVSLRGWLKHSVKDGKKEKFWAAIGNSILYFYKDQEEKIFARRIDLRDCRVVPVQSESEEIICLMFPSTCGQQRTDVHLFLSSKLEKESWLYRLHVASGGLSLPSSGVNGREANIGTLYERMVARLMYTALCGSDSMEDSVSVAAASRLWCNPVLSFSRDGLVKPLTTLSSDAMQTEAIKLIKNCQLFMNVMVDSSSVDYHVTLVQHVAYVCLTHPELQEEVYAQLIKHTNRKIVKQNTSGSPTTTVFEKSTSPSSTNEEIAILQIWKLMALLIPLFLPHQRMLWFLKAHLHRHTNEKTEIGQYVIYCQRVLLRATTCGSRRFPPSRTEIISILLQNPYHHSLPFSVPVHFLDGKYKVVSFDASTCVDEFIKYICMQACIREPLFSGFALLTNDPLHNSNVEHIILNSAKICDIISEWEKTFRENSLNKITDTSGMVKFTFCQHLSMAAGQVAETEKEKILLSYQTSMEICQGRFPVSRELAIELTALCAQMHEGEIHEGSCNMKEMLKKFYPNIYLENANKQQLRHLQEKLFEKWMLLKNISSMECARVFLNAVRKSAFYGAKLFKVELETKTKHKSVTKWLAVHENGAEELNCMTMEIDRSYSYDDIITFGGCGDHVMVVVEKCKGASNKFFYSMPNIKAVQMIFLIVEYMKVFISKNNPS